MASSPLTKQLPGFKLGRKEVFLPNFVLTLIRTPKLPPTFASFIVPLNLNKFDVRDYLYNVYDIRIKSARSYIQQQKLRQDKPGAVKPRQRKWHRAKAKKLMTVEMERPFAWPEEPKSYEPWDKETFDKAQEEQQKSRMRYDRTESKKMRDPETESIAIQAKRILRGEETWEPRTDIIDRTIEWGDNLKEVETDVELPKE